MCEGGDERRNERGRGGEGRVTRMMEGGKAGNETGGMGEEGWKDQRKGCRWREEGGGRKRE